LTKKVSARVPAILLVENEQGMATEIKCALEGKGYLVRTTSLAEAADAARVGHAAILILDRIAFGKDCLQTVELLRKEGVRVPVLVISVLSSIDQRVHGLRAGADDYLGKPFAMVELVARAEALMRRLQDMRATKLRVGDLEMDLIEQTVFRGHTKIDLLPREFKLLEYLLRHPGQAISRGKLLEEVWQCQFSFESNVVDVHVSNLRKKIDVRGAPSRIVSIRGAGFMLHAKT
jgi:two-component system, OmpR family, response regulator